ncbi:class F sortase [Nocardiopsis baichengensis]|uniref:class F sortase n=1 Tax=Nocardiopsis baichengensis TaxID=280240 RepID=UPI0009FBEE61|nr:class F sortase [Nocardiopsis baichengensis]
MQGRGRAWCLAAALTFAGVAAPFPEIGRGAAPAAVPPGRPASSAEAVSSRSAPVGVVVPSLDLHARRVVGLGIGADGGLEAPSGWHEVGWFSGGAAPGEDGPAVLVGHVDSHRGPAVFFGLESLGPGAVVGVERSDGATAWFEVYAVATYGKGREEFPTRRVYGATPGPELRLITCGGDFDEAAGSYRSNVVVFARLAP